MPHKHIKHEILTGGNKTTSGPVILYYFLVSNKKKCFGLSIPPDKVYLSFS